MLRYKCFIAGSSNGRTHASGACYLGSNPSPAAMKEKEWLSYISISLATSYIVGFIAWNSHLVHYGFFEYNLLQTRFISAGFLILFPLVSPFYIFPKGLSWVINKNNSTAVWRFLFVILAILYLFLSVNYLFPKFSQKIGGAAPFPLSIVADQTTLKTLEDFGVKPGDNANKTSLQTQSVCAIYSNEDFLIFGITKVDDNGVFRIDRFLVLKKEKVTGFEIGIKNACPPFIHLPYYPRR